MQNVLDNCSERMTKCIQSLKNEFQQMRTGRASASLFEKLKVDYYGTETPLNQVASISVPEARLVVIQPWDKSVLGAIEKAIQKSELGLNPNNDGKLIRVNFPPLTEQRRKELAKSAKQTAESSKVAIRNVRRDAMEELKSARTSRKTERLRFRSLLTLPYRRSRRSPKKKRRRSWRSDEAETSWHHHGWKWTLGRSKRA